MKFRSIFGVVFVLATAWVVYIQTRDITTTEEPRHAPVAEQAETPTGAVGPVSFPLTLTDMQGQTITLTAAPKKIVSLAPSTTELLFDLGVGDRIAADTTACDYPPEATSIPHVGGSDSMSLESVLAFNPDLVVADGAINGKIIQILTAAHIPTLVVEPHTVSETYDAIRLVGQATARTDDAARLIVDMQSRFNAIRKTIANATSRPKVLLMYGTDPIYTSGKGTFIDDLIKTAGGENIVDNADAQISPERVVALQPDVIICDASLIDKIKAMPGWKDSVPAVRDSTFFTASDQAILERGTPRLAQGAEELARDLHPELYNSDGTPAPLGTPSAARPQGPEAASAPTPLTH